MDKSPTVMGGRFAQFRNNTDMISHWEGLEWKEGGKEEPSVDGMGRKRLSKVIRELSGKFKEGRESQESQPGGRGRPQNEWTN